MPKKIIILFEIVNKEKKFQFFEKFFLFINFSKDIVLIILFFNLSNIKENFLKLILF